MNVIETEILDSILFEKFKGLELGVKDFSWG